MRCVRRTRGSQQQSIDLPLLNITLDYCLDFGSQLKQNKLTHSHITLSGFSSNKKISAICFNGNKIVSFSFAHIIAKHLSFSFQYPPALSGKLRNIISIDISNDCMFVSVFRWCQLWCMKLFIWFVDQSSAILLLLKRSSNFNFNCSFVQSVHSFD